MGTAPIITRVELSRYRIPTYDLATDVGFAMGQFYQPGAHGSRSRVGIKIHTDQGVTGEYMSGAPAAYEQMLMWVNFVIGKSALERERFYNQAKSILRKKRPNGCWTNRHHALGSSRKVPQCSDLPAIGRAP